MQSTFNRIFRLVPLRALVSATERVAAVSQLPAPRRLARPLAAPLVGAPLVFEVRLLSTATSAIASEPPLAAAAAGGAATPTPTAGGPAKSLRPPPETMEQLVARGAYTFPRHVVHEDAETAARMLATALKKVVKGKFGSYVEALELIGIWPPSNGQTRHDMIDNKKVFI